MTYFFFVFNVKIMTAATTAMEEDEKPKGCLIMA